MKYPFFILLFLVSSLQSNAQSGFYDLMTIQEIKIYFPFTDWDARLDDEKAGTDEYLTADSVLVNGEKFEGAGVKYKGNSSYDANRIKNPLHIKLDHTNDGTYYGVEDIKLGNGWSDNSMIREPMAYALLGQYMDAPRGNFARVYINDAYYGLMNNAEDIGNEFLFENYYSSKFEFFKCTPESIGSGLGNGPNLAYLGDDYTDYEGKYEIKSDTGWNQLIYLCDTLNNAFSAFPAIADVDRFLWMLAFNNATVNLDSYTGAFRQNYYLYRNHQGQWIPTVWDLNMCFGGFSVAGGLAGALTPATMPTMSHTLHKTESGWPLIYKLLNDPFYTRMYYAHLRTINAENFANGSYKTLAETLHALVDPEVQNDPNYLSTYANFQVSLEQNTDGSNGAGVSPGIYPLMDNRANYLENVLSAAAPSITAVGATNADVFGANAGVFATVQNTVAVYLGFRYRKSDRFLRIPMYDDGAHADGAADDNIFGAYLPLQSLEVQYYIYAENNATGTFSPERAEHEFYTLEPSLPLAAPGDLVLNEYTANNKSGIENEKGKNRDWIEVYNKTDNPLGLSGLFLSNDPTALLQWKFPEKAWIQPHEHLLLWADDLDETYLDLHTNFNLNKNGDHLILSDGASIWDEVLFGVQDNDAVEGRCPDGEGNFTKLTSKTPAATNDCSSGADLPVAKAPEFRIYPNPVSAEITIESDAALVKIQLIALTGQILLESKKTTIELHNLASGAYLLKAVATDGSTFTRHIVKI